MKYYAHSTEDRENFSQWQSLQQHLSGVAELAGKIAMEGCPQLYGPAVAAAKLHDLGKFRTEFQEYLQKRRKGGKDTQHSLYGAVYSFNKTWCGPTFAVAGHHSGLHDWGTLQQNIASSEARSLVDQLAKTVLETGVELPTELSEPGFLEEKPLKLEMYIRILFSILVDSDYLDTDRFYNGEATPAKRLEPATMLEKIFKARQGMSREGELNLLRNRIFEQCIRKAELPPGFFSLTAPTGGGKTIASMAFALAHAKRHNLRRVIVVIPFLSIIEQNAAVYRRVLDPDNEGYVIEHHSAVRPDENEDAHCEETSTPPPRLASENWDAPIIVTTSVQFLESLFANKPSKCRKLHNICRSVVLFDEVQTLPAHLLNPTLDVFRDLTENYGVSFVFSTATQPAFKISNSLPNGFSSGELREITDGTTEIFRTLRRVKLEFSPEPASWQQVSESMIQSSQALCVVNTRKQAFELWSELRKAVSQDDHFGVFHLSSAMCAEHRLELIGEDTNPKKGSIRWQLKNSLPCRVVSTQLIEAGVDLDFPMVLRALGPLDSIVQTAGRCNREFRLKDDTGQPMHGTVEVFIPEKATLPAGLYRSATDISRTFLETTIPDEIFTDPGIFPDYFSRLFSIINTDWCKNGETAIQEDRELLRFRETARKAVVIPESSYPILVNFGKADELIREIKTRSADCGSKRFGHTDMRRLQRCFVSLNKLDFMELEALGLVRPLLPNLGIFLLEEGLYNQNLGVMIGQRPAEDLIV